MLRALLLTLVTLLWSLATQGQTQAACTFNFFSTTTPFTYLGTQQFINPRGINDFGTIVGYTTPRKPRGLIRWANGGVVKVKGTRFLTARNDHGTSLGFDKSDNPILVNGPTSSPTITPIVFGANITGIPGDGLNGINKWGTIVGLGVVNNSVYHGFKRWNTGTTHTLDFPGASFTTPLGINDNGTVVGAYDGADGLTHGFIFNNGQWATLDYPQASYTALVGITNAGKIIGNAFVNSSQTPFLYDNGTFKVISVPNSAPGLVDLRSISPKLGLILGVTDINFGKPAFITQCQ